MGVTTLNGTRAFGNCLWGGLLVISMLSQGAWCSEGSTWLSSYAEAMKQAKDTHRMLFVYFHVDGADLEQDAFCRRLADPKLSEYLEKHVLVRVPLSTKARVDGQEIQLVRHGAFAELQASEGVAIIDLEDPGVRTTAMW